MNAILIGSCFGALGVVFGAFGAHLLRGKMSDELLVSFETGVRYQFYHALVLVLAGIAQHAGIIQEGHYVEIFTAGILLFSFSIYGLCLSSTFGSKWKFLGPITPLGGLLLVAGWLILAWAALPI